MTVEAHDFRFANRTDAEMDPSTPQHQAEHDAYAAEVMELSQHVKRVIENAPCPGSAMGALDHIGQMTDIGKSVVMLIDLQRQGKQSSGQSTTAAADLNNPDKPLPDIFGGLFRADGTLNPDY